KIMDFGLALIEDEGLRLTKTGSVFGTPDYMSPEQFAGHPDRIDHRTDIYALGVLLYELLTGRVPYPGETAIEIYDRKIRCLPELPSSFRSDLPPAVEAVCLKAMQRERDERFQSVEEMAAAFEKALARRGGWPRFFLVAGWNWRRSRRVRRMVAVLALATLLGVLGGVVLTRGASEPAPAPQSDEADPIEPGPGRDSPERPTVGELMARARDLETAGRRDRALETYGELLALDPSMAHVYHNKRGLLHRHMGQDDLAEAEYGESIRLAPSDFLDSMGNRAHLRYARHRYEDALADIDRALTIRRDSYFHWLRALVSARRGRLDDAAGDLARLGRMKPGSAQYLHARAMVELAAGDAAGALQTARALLVKPHPEWKEHLVLALALQASGGVLEAGEELDLVRSESVLFDRDLYRRARGRVAEERGDRALARTEYEAARSDNPDLPGIAEDLRRVE
ncbi:MAG: tetratricopeptide repeat protein, partial [Planctomycetes bacterium]|nr:tetratricopeptide repeat protein [Planctomycetota bacterium]